MPAIFLPGPFADDDMLRAVLGSSAGPAPRPETLPGFALGADAATARAALAPATGASAAGAVIEADATTAARLAFALAAFGAAAGPQPAETAAGAAATVFAAPAPVGPPLGPAPDPEWRAHLAEAAEEAMGHYGQRPAEAMAALMPGISYRALARVRGRAAPAPARRRSDFGEADVERLGVSRPYARYFAVEEHRLRHRRFDGGLSEVIERAVFASGDAVTVTPFDPRRRTVLLVEQFRAGPYARRDPRPWCLEAVAGRCDAGEGPEATARREAREEAGIELGRIERMFGYYPTPGFAAEHITGFAGEADLSAAGGLHGVAAEHEDIRALVLPLAEAMELVRAGEVNNAPLLLALLWLDREADRLARDWA